MKKQNQTNRVGWIKNQENRKEEEVMKKQYQINRMGWIKGGLLVVAMGVVAASTGHATLLANGNFEGGYYGDPGPGSSFSFGVTNVIANGWVPVIPPGPGTAMAVDLAPTLSPLAGSYSGFGFGYSAGFSQAIPTVSNFVYELSLIYTNYGANFFYAIAQKDTVGGAQLGVLGLYGGGTTNKQFTALSSTTVIEFVTVSASWFEVDNVDVALLTVPEPATVLLAGLGGLLVWRRHRRNLR